MYDETVLWAFSGGREQENVFRILQGLEETIFGNFLMENRYVKFCGNYCCLVGFYADLKWPKINDTFFLPTDENLIFLRVNFVERHPIFYLMSFWKSVDFLGNWVDTKWNRRMNINWLNILEKFCRKPSVKPVTETKIHRIPLKTRNQFNNSLKRDNNECRVGMKLLPYIIPTI